MVPTTVNIVVTLLTAELMNKGRDIAHFENLLPKCLPNLVALGLMVCPVDRFERFLHPACHLTEITDTVCQPINLMLKSCLISIVSVKTESLYHPLFSNYSIKVYLRALELPYAKKPRCV
ncbi:hypothetical protein AVEN_146306-1, partial [Araneus ventricosus]